LHWKALGITVPTLIGAMGGIYATYKAQRQKRLDTRVFDTLVNHSWSRKRPFTGGGEYCVRAAEIADVLNLNLDAVADSLERMEIKDRVRRTEGDAPPYWFIVRR